MNCQPGDLACICIPSRLDGKFCTVLRRAYDLEECAYGTYAEPGVATWLIHLHVPIRSVHDGQMYSELQLADKYLRPIRDLGDDAVDESKAWLPPVPLPAIDPSLLPTKERA
jgi:hypothetical protein